MCCIKWYYLLVESFNPYNGELFNPSAITSTKPAAVKLKVIQFLNFRDQNLPNSHPDKWIYGGNF